MATKRNVIVLAPNGRRQNVQVTLNTTILQILEEVCKKHGYNTDDYDLKHFNHILDPNAIFRFTGLANNAQLEVVPCKKIRSTSAVTIGIQLENGERLMGEFIPNTSLTEVLKNVKLDEDLEKIMLVYMHQMISGAEALKNTTLKSLGLNNGKAILRVIHRKPQTMNTIASTSSETLNIHKNANINKQNDKNKCSLTMDTNKTSDSILLKEETHELKKLEECSQSTQRDKENQMLPSTSKDDCVEKQTLVYSCNKREIDDLNNVEFLGERNALVFNQASIQGTFRDELPDDFYDLTVDDAKILLRDVKRYRQQLEEAPLLTNVQRKLNQDKQTLNQLHKYRYTIIRIQFPDEFVLQGLFRPMERVQTIKDFIKNYLIDANSDFIIFTTPPKRILDPKSHLINENLVPSAIIHYSGPSALKLDIKQKFTDPKKVEMQVTKIR
ncbi:Tether containing UBX domain for GLUT4 [Habropoda laboriosa]|uniref:Tether containing UBX domain for GLUT4 n=2 Tax=Habropoda laboriosa TaxID=597456 RepID=A0A0L7QNX0_9HYME|nr:Tether containing UBX domain for GLUT4 [Habropoda laboriosa]